MLVELDSTSRRSQLWFGLTWPCRYTANLNPSAVVAKGLDLIRGDSLLEKFVMFLSMESKDSC
ncbi:hypothetical protein PS726_01815 [Pseudomonas fluorescens]|nr:hypothetical protein PS647_01320 [Pseudomonas fluorescens]VVN90187.1 hypothetical protein PS726_01815 [Pseudomonas fluorescens]VVO55564.1 hypothetical protein PS843_00508 [Pseudomonas fluorescens]